MNSRDFLDVRVICETGSLRRAAKVLGITQPTLSVRIKHFEDQLGMPLFDRRRGHSEPTDLALFIARRTELMAGEEGRLTAELGRLASGKTGVVRIGLGPALTRLLVGKLITSIHDDSPNLNIEVVSGPVDELAAALRQRELDLLVSEPPSLRHEEISSEVVYESDMVAVARPDHPMCGSPPADLAGLLRYPIAISFLSDHWQATLRDDFGIDLEAHPGHVFCSDFEMVVRIVACSRSLFTVGPRLGFESELESGNLAIVSTAVPFRHTILVQKNSDAFPLPAVNKAHASIRRVFEAVRAGHA